MKRKEKKNNILFENSDLNSEFRIFARKLAVEVRCKFTSEWTQRFTRGVRMQNNYPSPSQKMDLAVSELPTSHLANVS